MGCGGKITKRYLHKIPNDGDTSRGSFGINGNALTAFPYSGEEIRKNFSRTFCFLEDEDKRFILHNFSFKRYMLGGTVEAANVPGDELHGIPWEAEEKNFVS